MKGVVVTADGLGANWVGAYGAEWLETPALDRLAAAGVVFDWHFAEADAGDDPRRTGRVTPGDAPHLPDWLARHGVAFLDGDDALEQLAALDGPGLAWVELPPLDLDDVPESPTDDDIDELLAALGRQAAEADELVAALLDALAEAGLGDAFLLFTSAYGVGVGEHGRFGPAASVHEEFVHVPLVLRLPGAAHAGRRVAALTQSADVYLTLCELLGVPVPAGLHGRVLLPLAAGAAEAVRPYVVLTAGGEAALRTPDWLLVRPPEGGPRLFEKPADRWEVNDLRQHHLERVDAMLATLAAYEAAVGREPFEVPPLAEPAEAEDDGQPSAEGVP